MCFWFLLIAVSKSSVLIIYDEYKIDKSNDILSKIHYFQDERSEHTNVFGLSFPVFCCYS